MFLKRSILFIKENFAAKVLLGMFLGIIFGLVIKNIAIDQGVKHFIVNNVLDTGGMIFITLIKMLVVPVVLVSLICGVSALKDLKSLGRIGIKTLLLYILTTAAAIALALCFAEFFQVGHSSSVAISNAKYVHTSIPSLKQTILNMFPHNPFEALHQGNMLQIIVFALLFGIAMVKSGKAGERMTARFNDLDKIIMSFITMIMKTAPVGVFFLLSSLFAKMGVGLIQELLSYFLVVLLVLAVQLVFVYSAFIRVFGGLNPITFIKKMYSAMLFAFSISSSSASIPTVLDTVENKLGVKNSVASFVIPLGATVNMDGTAIMQGVATVFISHIYNIHIGLTGYLTVIFMATVASIGTAGVPGVGLITLAMVLHQVGLPVEGVGLIIGVDRLLDMARTAVNVAGDAMIACIVANSENQIDEDVFNGS